ncbi:RsmB/NOP family class I SAM-dependent RNA methyltransferase [Sphingomonas lutea]|uniref:RsmB/NOP family class I SAM-dependent RNA methyltransferase n=1 Tax=Sphingomonas lutea TaxID=1045317 RepID=A0A7G9SFV1_9SPHN|nr:RsmB/NOP family class I SAM-dependent RNA methyltransferase [Sphingomonas lutea]QNN66726.1 RsmB/NOP family class I SAM-dependent RNA methyltransferase [Sphingomonas lutea]
MTPAARLQATAEIIDEVIASARSDGPPADSIVTRYFKQRRYAGSKDRRAVRELVFRVIRLFGDMPANGRAAVLGLVAQEPELADLLGEPRGPEPRAPGEGAAEPRLVPAWLLDQFSPLITPEERPALLERAPLDLRVNAARAERNDLIAEFEGGTATRLSPWGIRLPADTRIDDQPAFASGLVEVQDEGSQLIALACAVGEGDRVVDLCAGAGGKALAIAAAAPSATILATDSNRARLSKLAPRADRAGAKIETRLLNPPNELAELEDWHAGADIVLVDAPCSGSGTWRRNPEGRWRLTPQRLDKVVATQAHLLDMAAELVRPGGSLIYAVCSILSREGAGQVDDFLIRHSSWHAQNIPIAAGRSDGAGRLLTPGHDATDGFFVARLERPC